MGIPVHRYGTRGTDEQGEITFGRHLGLRPAAVGRVTGGDVSVAGAEVVVWVLRDPGKIDRLTAVVLKR